MKVRLRYVNRYTDRHGRARTYYRRGKAPQQIIEGEPGSPEWLANYQRIHEGYEAPPRLPPDYLSFRASVTAYMQSGYFKKLADNTQKNYRYALNNLTDHLGDWKVDAFTKGDIAKIRDQLSRKSPTKANFALVVLKLVFDLAMERDLIKINPAAGVRRVPGYTSTPHEQWADHQISAFLEGASPYLRRAITVLLYTGLRCSDACALRRADIKDGSIPLVTAKTKKPIVVALHADLEAELARPLPVESIYLISGSRGQQMNRHSLYSAAKRAYAGLDIGQMPPLHGLRRNAVAALVESDCSPREIQAITGQSLQMIEHYAQDYRRAAFSRRAMDKWEAKNKT